MSIAASAVLSSLSLPGFRKPSTAQAPSRKWPFPPEPASQSPASLGDVRKMATNQVVSRRDMVLDVLMVVAWGAAIPLLMWLGASAGF